MSISVFTRDLPMPMIANTMEEMVLVTSRTRGQHDVDARVVRAAARIRELIGGTSLQLALAVGSIVVEELYGGDLGRWRERGPKEHTLRQLAADPRLGISASALYRAIAIYEIRAKTRENPMWDKLTLCQIRPVLGLPESEQARLLGMAAKHGWTTRAIEDAAAESRVQHKSSRGGRPRKPGFARSIEHAERALSEEDVVFGDLDALHSMSPEQRVEIERRLSFVRQRCEELASLLAASSST